MTADARGEAFPPTVLTSTPRGAISRVEIGDWSVEADTAEQLVEKIDAKIAAAQVQKDDAVAALRQWTAARKIAGSAVPEPGFVSEGDG